MTKTTEQTDERRDVVARLLLMEGSSGDRHMWHRNPDGLQAAALIEAQAGEIERLREALKEIDRGDTYSSKSYGGYAKIARAALAASKPEGGT